MIARLSAVTAWLAVGHATLFALFWLLLSLPESNIAMLAASALVVAAMAFVGGVVEGGGLIGWHPGVAPMDIPRRALQALPAVWLGAVVFAIVWLSADHAASWWQQRRGETDAWLMAQFGWPDTGNLHTAMDWVFAWVANVLGLSLAVSLAGSVVLGGVRQAGRPNWLRGGVSPRRLLPLTGILVLFLWLPWTGVNWRPSWLAPNWQEASFVILKLGVLFLVANVGWALVLATARRR